MIQKSKYRADYNDEKIYGVELRTCGDGIQRQWSLVKTFKEMRDCLESLRAHKKNNYSFILDNGQKYWYEFRPVHVNYNINEYPIRY